MFNTLEDAFFWLESFANLERNAKNLKDHYKLERMNCLLEQFGNPQMDFKIIHIAGSKGKGSCGVFLARALGAIGLKTGLYSSPHVLHYRERIQIDGSPLDDVSYISMITKIRELVDLNLPGEKSPSTFELLTLLAFMLFREKGCEWGVVETGLGGRLDATNTVMPEAVLLTPIELEHRDWLGDSLVKIAREKAGIIKEGKAVYSAPQDPEVMMVFREKAALMNAPFFPLDEILKDVEVDENLEGTSYTLNYREAEEIGGAGSLGGRLQILGKIQPWNAALALECLKGLFPGSPVGPWLKGFESAFLPARMEVIQKSPLHIVDGSHTPASLLLAEESFSTLSRRCRGNLLFACQDDKDIAAIASLLGEKFNEICISSPGFFKKSHPERVLESFMIYNNNCILEKDPAAAYRCMREKGLPLLICGSFYLAGEIKKFLQIDNLGDNDA